MVKSLDTTDKLTDQKQWKHRKLIKNTLSQLTNALILFKMKTGNKGDYSVKPLAFNEDWEIVVVNRQEKNKKGPVDVLWDIGKINILETQRSLFDDINKEEWLSLEEREKYKGAIRQFVRTHFIKARENLENKKVSPYSKFRAFYTKLAKEKSADPKEQLQYRDIYLTLANMLYEKNKSFLNENGEINESWLREIAIIFLKTIKNIPNSGSSKSFHKIFHDGDFNFLRKENDAWEPMVGTLDHYVEAIQYLMDLDGYNAYAEWGNVGAEEWMKSKKSFLNNLFVGSKLNGEGRHEVYSDKKLLHNKLSSLWTETIGEFLKSDSKMLHHRVPFNRLKSESSIFQKLWGRTENIQDESGLRVVYYKDKREKAYCVDQDIVEILKSYCKKIVDLDGVDIVSLQLDKKWNFISEEGQEEILNLLSEITGCEDITYRIKPKKSADRLDSISSKYHHLTKTKPTPGLKSAYEIANATKRGSNGNQYKDFKIIAKLSLDQEVYNAHLEDQELEIKKDLDLSQEISFYPYTNDLNIGNHHFLDLEKKIFLRVKNMNDMELWKSISLNKLRYFTETTLKDISFDIDVFEDKVKKGLLPTPENDHYAYLVLDWEKISLKGLIYRNRNNSERFDKLISMVINYFLKSNKIWYLNKKDTIHSGLVSPEMLRNPQEFKSRRFLTSDVLRTSALDASNAENSVCFYTNNKDSYIIPHFYNVSLGDLGDFIALEKC